MCVYYHKMLFRTNIVPIIEMYIHILVDKLVCVLQKNSCKKIPIFYVFIRNINNRSYLLLQIWDWGCRFGGINSFSSFSELF